MIGKQDPLDSLLARLGSLDAEERLSTLASLKRYAGTRKVDQAVFELRNDGDRRIRELAREILAESDNRVSSALAVPGAEKKEAEERLSDLLALFRSQDPTDRVTALKELRQMSHPRAIEAVEKAKKDPNRVVRMVAGFASEERATGSSRVSGPSRFEGNIMLTGIDPEPGSGEGGGSSAPAWPELVPFVGLLYLAGGVPLAIVFLWLWMGDQHLASGVLAPDPVLRSTLQSLLPFKLGPLLLALSFTVSAVQGVIGAGILARRDWGRKAAVSFHAVMGVCSLLVPEILAKITLLAIHLGWVLLYSRPAVIRVFEDPHRPSGPAPPATYGTMERKSW